MKPWSGQVEPSWVLGLFLSRGLRLLVSRRRDPTPGHPTGVPRHADHPREDRTRLSEVTDAPNGLCARPHPSDPPRRPFVRPRSVTPGCHSPRPSSELTRTGPPCSTG